MRCYPQSKTDILWPQWGYYYRNLFSRSGNSRGDSPQEINWALRSGFLSISPQPHVVMVKLIGITVVGWSSCRGFPGDGEACLLLSPRKGRISSKPQQKKSGGCDLSYPPLFYAFFTWVMFCVFAVPLML